jgi:hypothetical protein
MVLRLRGCLPRLPRGERRVLILRARLGAPRPRPRARVANILDVSAHRVARIERRALRRLGRLALQDCGATGGLAVAASDDAALAASDAAVPAGVTGSTTHGNDSAGASDRSAVKGEHAEHRGEPRQPKRDAQDISGLFIPHNSMPTLIAAGLGGLVLLGGVAYLLMRRRRLRGYSDYY